MLVTRKGTVITKIHFRLIPSAHLEDRLNVTMLPSIDSEWQNAGDVSWFQCCKIHRAYVLTRLGVLVARYVGL